MPAALLSVKDKTGIVPFGQGLPDCGYDDLWASGGTATALTEAGVKVRDVAELTGHEARFGHRLVTLDGSVHEGLIVEDTPEHRAEFAQRNAPWFDLLVVDPYATHHMIAERRPHEEIIEGFDVGGPSLLSSAIKGNRLIICDRREYGEALLVLRRNQEARTTFWQARRKMAQLCCLGIDALKAWYLEPNGSEEESLIWSRIVECRDFPDRYPTTGSFFIAVGEALLFA